MATESVLLSLAGGVAGVAWTWAGLRALIGTILSAYPDVHEVTFDRTVVAVAAVVSLATGLVFGVVPALQSARVRCEWHDRRHAGASLLARRRADRALLQVDLLDDAPREIVGLVGDGSRLMSASQPTSAPVLIQPKGRAPPSDVGLRPLVSALIESEVRRRIAEVAASPRHFRRRGRGGHRRIMAPPSRRLSSCSAQINVLRQTLAFIIVTGIVLCAVDFCSRTAAFPMFRYPGGAVVVYGLSMTLAWVTRRVVPFVLPPGYYRLRPFELQGRVYRHLGVERFKRLLFESRIELLNLSARLSRGKRGLPAFERGIREAETDHAIVLLVMVVVTIYASMHAWWAFTAWLVLANIVANVYPVMLQRYNRARLLPILDRLSAQEGRRAARS